MGIGIGPPRDDDKIIGIQIIPLRDQYGRPAGQEVLYHIIERKI